MAFRDLSRESTWQRNTTVLVIEIIVAPEGISDYEMTDECVSPEQSGYLVLETCFQNCFSPSLLLDEPDIKNRITACNTKSDTDYRAN